jgi:S1-C subfamily serine protease
MRRLLLFSLFTALNIGMFAQSLPKDLAKAVVAIGHDEVEDGGKHDWVNSATGFLYGYMVQPNADASKRVYRIFLVTDRHVLDDAINKGQLTVRINSKTGEASERTIPLTDGFGHPVWRESADAKIDVGVVALDFNSMKVDQQDVIFLPNDIVATREDRLRSMKVGEGETVFVLGFPLDLNGVDKNYIIVRRGSIARIGDLLEDRAKTFLIDSFVFSGNSGGPVFLQPTFFGTDQSPARQSWYLIGVVKSYITENDYAISKRTGKVLLAVQENSGLSEVSPVDSIDDLILKLLPAIAK